MKQHGHVVSMGQIRRFVQKQPVRQIFHQPKNPTSDKQGKIVALSIHERWMADLIDLTAQPSVSHDHVNTPGGSSGSNNPNASFRYILVVQNVFSRELYVRALKSKDAETVAGAFKHILDENFPPGRVDTDNGPEFQGPFQQLLAREKITHILKDPNDKNSLGTIDRAIQLFKQALFRRMAAEHTSNWSSLLTATVNGMNETVHSALHGRVPEQVEVDDVLQFHLRQEASEALQRNHDNNEARVAKLQRLGAFRPADSRRSFQRSFHPKYSDSLHRVTDVDMMGNIKDEHGNSYSSKRVLAVPATTNRAAPAQAIGGMRGSLLTENVRKASLHPFADRLEEFLGLDVFSLTKVVNKMKELGMAKLMVKGLSYKSALELLGFKLERRENGKYTVTGKRARTPAAAHL